MQNKDELCLIISLKNETKGVQAIQAFNSFVARNNKQYAESFILKSLNGGVLKYTVKPYKYFCGGSMSPCKLLADIFALRSESKISRQLATPGALKDFVEVIYISGDLIHNKTK